MSNVGKLLASLVMLIGVSYDTHADPITVYDTTRSDQGNINCFCTPDTATYGQTFVATGESNRLVSFSLFLRGRFAGEETLDLRGYVGECDGTKVRRLLFESKTETMNAAGELQEFAFQPQLSLHDGTYVAFLSFSNLPPQPFNEGFEMPWGSDQIPGQFVFLNSGFDAIRWSLDTWEDFGATHDVWFKAQVVGSQAPVPEPATALLIATAGAIYGIGRRVRKS